jgi:hypothetical protein
MTPTPAQIEALAAVICHAPFPPLKRLARRIVKAVNAAEGGNG